MVRALLLGLVQGLTEFLPVSSSAHLVLVPYFTGWPPPRLTFDVALHLGTLAAVVWHFRADLVQLARGFVNGGEGRRLLGLVAAGSIPVAIAGMAFASSVERVFAEPLWTAGLLLVMAAWLMAGERAAGRPALPTTADVDEGDQQLTSQRQIGRNLRWSDAAVVGVAQAAALLPGISRSGSTIATGLLQGVDRQTAARFSFLLSIPAITGAVVAQLPDLGVAQVAPVDVAVGVGAAFVSGLWAIRWLLRVISTRGLTGFAVYLALLASVVLVSGRP